MTEEALLRALDEHDGLLDMLVRGEFTFTEFLTRYADFYWAYALDGHEAGEPESTMIGRYHDRIEVHRRVCEDVLGRLASDADAQTPAYRKAGRIDSAEARQLIESIVEGRQVGG